MILWLLACLLLLPFGYVLLFGAPYLPTRKNEAKQALDLLDLKKGEVFVDLGSGDGAVLIEAAKRGLVCYGYELNPFMWVISYVRTLPYRKSVTVYCRNFWRIPLPIKTKGVFVFLLDPYMIRLNQKLTNELQPGGRLVSYTFQIPGREPVKTRGAMFVYQY